MFNSINQLFASLLTLIADSTGGNLGISIVLLTVLIRLVLVPIMIPSLKSHKKITALKPKMDALKKEFGHDKQLLSQKQLELYKQEGINPAAGCLPQIVQIVLFFIFYQVLLTNLRGGISENYGLDFLWFNLQSPDRTFVLPVLTALTQLVLGVMLLPATSTVAEKKLALSTKNKKDDKEAFDMTEMATTMQSQMVLVMPIMIGVAALNFPSGLALYWITSTLFSIIQQYFVSGVGGLKKYLPWLSINK